MRLQQQNAKAYILGGYAVVTFINILTKNQYTFQVKRKSKTEDLWFVKVHYKDTIATIRGENTVFVATTASDKYPKERDVFGYVWNRILTQSLPEKIHILHNGRCSRCKMELTDAVSIYLGFGPTCAKKLGIPFKLPEL